MEFSISSIGRFNLILIAIIVFGSLGLVIMNQPGINDGWIYEENREGYVRENGITYPIDNQEKFTIKQFSITSTTSTYSDFEVPSVNYVIVDPKEDALPVVVTKPYKPMNFFLTIEYLPDNVTIESVNFEMLLFRDNIDGSRSAYIGSIEQNFFYTQRNEEWNRRLNPNFFNVNIEYNETKLVNGEETTYIVNAELATNNDPDTGRVIRSAAHIIKRTVSGDIVSDVSHTVRELNIVQRNLMVFNQPSLQVPLLFLGGYILVKVYSKGADFYTNYEIKITKKVEAKSKEDNNTNGKTLGENSDEKNSDD